MYMVGFFILFNGMFISSSYGGDLAGTPKFVKDYNSGIVDIPNSLDVKSRVPKKKFWGPLPILPVSEVTYSTDRLVDYSKHLVKRGVKIINFSAKEIMNHTDGEKKNPLKIYYVTTDYVKNIQNFVDHLKENYGKGSSQPVGEEFMILNMLEKACEILYQQQWLLISTIATNPTKELISKIHKFSKNINNQIKRWRKEEMQYICSVFRICKPYPAFSNRLEDLILELLKLPDSKLNKFMNTLKTIVAGNENFLALVGGVQGKDKAFKKINDLCHHSSLKESLTSIRAILSRKYKISKSQSKSRTQATKVLLDIIDKAFLFNRDKNIVLNFENLNQVIKKWNNNKAELDDLLLEQLINEILKTINSIENPMKSTLIRIIMTID